MSIKRSRLFEVHLLELIFSAGAPALAGRAGLPLLARALVRGGAEWFWAASTISRMVLLRASAPLSSNSLCSSLTVVR